MTYELDLSSTGIWYTSGTSPPALSRGFVSLGFFDDALLCSQLSILQIVNVVQFIFHKA